MKRTLIGIVLMLASIAGIVGWEMFGREKLLFTDVLCLNQEAEASTVITQDMLAVKKSYMPMDGAYTAENAEKLIGKAASQYIPYGAELCERYFTDDSLQIGEYEYVFSIPQTSLKSYPRSISRGDTVYIYSYENFLTETTVLAVRDAAGNEIVSEANRARVSAQISTIEVKVDTEQLKLLSSCIGEGNVLSIAYN